MEPFKFMKTSDIIVLCSTKNERIEQFQIEMIDSFVKNTPNEGNMLVIENNSTYDSHKRWKDYVESKKQKFVYLDGEFNMNRFYNIGTSMTHNEYIMYCSSDIVFHEKWHENLLSWYDKIDNLFVTTPFAKAFDWDNSPEVLCETSVYRKKLDYIDKFVDSIHLGGWFGCFPRKFNWVWDEKFKAHYQDADMVNTIREIRNDNATLITGVAYNSRIDHMVGGTAKNSETSDYYTLQGREEMIKKWGGW